MTSIKHLEDLKPRQILRVLDLDWSYSEKLDGSSLVFGLDDQGRFYSKRKGGGPCYAVGDWSGELWAEDFRRGHVVAEIFVDAMLQEQFIRAGDEFGAELLFGKMPNATFYGLDVDTLVITTTPRTMPESFYVFLLRFEAQFTHVNRWSHDGVNLTFAETQAQVFVRKNMVISYFNGHSKVNTWISQRLGTTAANTRNFMLSWFSGSSEIKGLTVLDVLEASLTRRPPQIAPEDWSEIKPKFKAERERLRSMLSAVVTVFKDAALSVLMITMSGVSKKPYNQKEGFVINCGGLTFKLVDREEFSAKNLFAHRIKYMLVGGRRPPRPSFMSRTAQWSKEARLARLDVLLQRYLQHHRNLRYNGPRRFTPVSGSGLNYVREIHQRTLNLFHDVRKRIEDGR